LRCSEAREQLLALRELPIHPRIAGHIDRVLPLLVPGLDPALRDLVVADLDDAYEWATDVVRARRMARPPVEPPWLLWDSYPAAVYAPYRGALPMRP
jgi:hypothetical protein